MGQALNLSPEPVPGIGCPALAVPLGPCAGASPAIARFERDDSDCLSRPELPRRTRNLSPQRVPNPLLIRTADDRRSAVVDDGTCIPACPISCRRALSSPAGVGCEPAGGPVRAVGGDDFDRGEGR